ncbi:MAG: 3-dehydroquinate synthase [Bacteroidota bacterium]
MRFKPIQQNFSVNYEYKLYFTQGLFALENLLFKEVFESYKKDKASKVFFVIDGGVAKHHPKLQKDIERYCKAYKSVLQFTGSLVMPGGEQSKNDPDNVDTILEKVNELSICRHSFIAVIGGGALTDMVGYAAAIAHRGVKLIRIPTTVLSQNDSAVGVKNSINYFGKKNFLGTFATPYAIINDMGFLDTLEQRDWIAGVSEAVKVALIKDSEFFDYLEANALRFREREADPMQYMIYKCAEIHMVHIAYGGDPFETGSSRPLDFGHWAAHKLEQMTNYTIRHGEAVAKGIALDVTYAQLIGLIPKRTQERILRVFEIMGFDLCIPVTSKKEISQLLQGIEEFREHLGGELCITLISAIGIQEDVNTVDLSLMQQAITVLNDSCKVKVG